jgi:hypothetical protein
MQGSLSESWLWPKDCFEFNHFPPNVHSSHAFSALTRAVWDATLLTSNSGVGQSGFRHQFGCQATGASYPGRGRINGVNPISGDDQEQQWDCASGKIKG